ncbi:hypothetical protein GH714_008252 [Hevea brasiliensis]|uniref:Sodium/calcium exchanger membrane region domain-containing protein n=1 Tax=Hevea brasiliensis TaxID=3981 RepID=A0A6A6KKF3_HEVBR|nr:hypothetical protein GH714_008252 [Hevea brasiliensis]
MASSQEPWLLEHGNLKGLSKEMRHGRTAHNMSSSSLRKKSDLTLVSKLRCGLLRNLLTNLQEVILGTKLSVLFPAIPLAILAECYGFGRPWVFALSLLALTPLAERVSFLTEQIAYYTGPTVGGLLNATCGNATELIIAILALSQRKIEVVKYSLLGSILSNLLLVLGTSLFCGGIAHLRSEQNMIEISSASAALTAIPTLHLSRASSFVMLLGYIAYIIFQLVTHRQLFEASEESADGDDDDVISEEAPVIGFWSGIVWLVGMTAVIALLSEFVVGTIEGASDSWGLSVSFISIILLPIVGNAAEHAGAVIFAFKNKLVPLCVVVAWIMGIEMDLNFNLLETGTLALAIIATAFTLQDGTSHYLKGLACCSATLSLEHAFSYPKHPFIKEMSPILESRQHLE